MCSIDDDDHHHHHHHHHDLEELVTSQDLVAARGRSREVASRRRVGRG